MPIPQNEVAWIEATLALLESYRLYDRFVDLSWLPPDEPEPALQCITARELFERGQTGPFPDFFGEVVRHLADLGPERLGLLEQLYQFGRDRLNGGRAAWKRYERQRGDRGLAAYLAGKTNAVACIRKGLSYAEARDAVTRVGAA